MCEQAYGLTTCRITKNVEDLHFFWGKYFVIQSNTTLDTSFGPLKAFLSEQLQKSDGLFSLYILYIKYVIPAVSDVYSPQNVNKWHQKQNISLLIGKGQYLHLLSNFKFANNKYLSGTRVILQGQYWNSILFYSMYNSCLCFSQNRGHVSFLHSKDASWNKSVISLQFFVFWGILPLFPLSHSFVSLIYTVMNDTNLDWYC